MNAAVMTSLAESDDGRDNQQIMEWLWQTFHDERNDQLHGDWDRKYGRIFQNMLPVYGDLNDIATSCQISDVYTATSQEEDTTL